MLYNVHQGGNYVVANQGASQIQDRQEVTSVDRKELNELLGMSEEEIDEMARPFEEGTWDPSQFGEVIAGRPPMFDEPLRPVTFKEPQSTIEAIDARASECGLSRSDYLRSLVAKDLALVR